MNTVKAEGIDIDSLPNLSAKEFALSLTTVRTQMTKILVEVAGLEITTLLTRTFLPISQAIVSDTDPGRRLEKVEALTQTIQRTVRDVLQIKPLDNTVRNLLLQFLQRLAPETTDGPTPLPYRILPPGEGIVPEETGLQKETNVNPIDHPRVEWALDIAQSFDASFSASQHFFVSQLDAEVKQRPYHAILFPSIRRCVFVCDSYSNATYIVPIDLWEDWARNHKIEDLRQAAEAYQQNTENPHVTWFPMQENASKWKAKLLSELQAKPTPRIKKRTTILQKRTFEDWIALLLDFYRTYQRWPLQSSENKEEMLLYKKIVTLRTAYRNEKLIQENKRDQVNSRHRLSKDQEQRLLEVGILLDTESEQEKRFREQISACLLIRAQKGRWPSKYYPEECFLASKLQAWREGYKNEKLLQKSKHVKLRNGYRLSKEREKRILDAGIPLDMSAKREEQFQRDLQGCISFFQKHGYWPGLRSTDVTERTLAIRIHHWRTGFRNERRKRNGEQSTSCHRLSEDHIRQILAAGILLDTEAEFEEQFQKYLQDCTTFFDRLGRCPKWNRSDPVENELAIRIQFWRKGFMNELSIKTGENVTHPERLSEKHIELILAAGIVLNMKSQREHQFQSDMNACVMFYKQYKRWPSSMATIPGEKRMGTKIARWRIGHKNEYLIKKGLAPATGHRLSEDHARQLIEAGIIKPDPDIKA